MPFGGIYDSLEINALFLQLFFIVILGGHLLSKNRDL